MRNRSKHVEFTRENAVAGMLDACDFAFEFGQESASETAVARSEIEWR